MDADDFDTSNCTSDCTALCYHFEAWYREGMSAAWKQVGDGVRGIGEIAAGARGDAK
ncbi:hypothetical protein [Streptomyces alboviridis]|uniref:hypothetical protein n=1 Tax=Streptomyces alboviridis TaxID=67269 RepID=UPI00131A5E31|nr:hypothetical protein [Streptomyces alboviridis]